MSEEKLETNEISLTQEQIAVIKLYNQQIFSIVNQYIPIARRIGDLEEQLELAKTDEKRLRFQLNQQEQARATKLNEFAKELGHTPDKSWGYDADNFCFISKG